MEGTEYQLPDFPHWKSDQFEGHYGNYRLNRQGKEIAKKQVWAWVHWQTQVSYREYDPQELEEGSSRTYGVGAGQCQLNEAGKSQARSQGWVWNATEDVPEIFLEPVVIDRKIDPWDYHEPVSNADYDTSWPRVLPDPFDSSMWIVPIGPEPAEPKKIDPLQDLYGEEK